MSYKCYKAKVVNIIALLCKVQMKYEMYGYMNEREKSYISVGRVFMNRCERYKTIHWNMHPQLNIEQCHYLFVFNSS